MRLSGKVVAACAVVGFIAGCGQQQAAVTSASPADYEKTLRTQLETAKPGDVITIPAGTFPMTRSLVLSASGVTIKGAGMDKSVLSFKGQLAGAEGLLVNASNFTIEDVAIEDTKGDALKVNEGSNIVIRRVRTEWTGGPSTQNGAYGIYPVMTAEHADRRFDRDRRIRRRHLRRPVAATSSSATAAPNSTWPASRSRTRSAPTCTTTSPRTTPAAFSSSTCRT